MFPGPIQPWATHQPTLQLSLSNTVTAKLKRKYEVNLLGCIILSSMHFCARPSHFRVCHLGEQLDYVKTKTCSLVGRHACVSCVMRSSFPLGLKTLLSPFLCRKNEYKGLTFSHLRHLGVKLVGILVECCFPYCPPS